MVAEEGAITSLFISLDYDHDNQRSDGLTKSRSLSGPAPHSNRRRLGKMLPMIESQRTCDAGDRMRGCELARETTTGIVVGVGRYIGVMTPNMQMEQLSLAYVRAVAADVGYQVTRPEVDVDSVDGILMGSSGGRGRIDFQAKATTQDVLSGNELRFPLPVKNYDDLRADTLTPRLLIVLLMPRERGEWLQHSLRELCLRRCAYWLSLEDCPSTSNSHTVTVSVPARNMFDGGNLVGLMDKAARGEPLC